MHHQRKMMKRWKRGLLSNKISTSKSSSECVILSSD